MGALSTLIWFAAGAVGLFAVGFVALFIARQRYLASGQEEGE